MVVGEGRHAHVMPADGDHPAAGHEARVDCPVCRPIALRDPIDDGVVWSHYEPTWPGAIAEQRIDA